jgi:hypothetical protein
MRGPLDQQPNEPGWWLAADGKWYPPESAAGSEAQAAPPRSGSAPSAPTSGGNGFAVAALVLGIIGFLFGFIPLTFFMAGLLGILAVIFGVVGRKRAKQRGLKTGTATTGTVFGILAIIMSIVGLIILVTVVNDTSNKLNDIGGGASPSKYQVTVSNCTLDPTLNVPTASGTLVNTSGSQKSFIVSIRFVNAAGTQIGTGTDFVNDVSAGTKANWTATGTSGGRPARCEVSSLSAS